MYWFQLEIKSLGSICIHFLSKSFNYSPKKIHKPKGNPSVLISLSVIIIVMSLLFYLLQKYKLHPL